MSQEFRPFDPPVFEEPFIADPVIENLIVSIEERTNFKMDVAIPQEVFNELQEHLPEGEHVRDHFLGTLYTKDSIAGFVMPYTYQGWATWWKLNRWDKYPHLTLSKGSE